MVTPLEYNSGLSLEEATKKYQEVKDEFEKVKSRYTDKVRYSGIFSFFIKKMDKEDQKTLTDCIGVLLPLTLEKSVQDEVQQSKSPEMMETSLLSKAGQLFTEIGSYLANFKNTGVKQYARDYNLLD